MSDITFFQPDYEEMTLPSNGYGPQKIKKILIRPMTMAEERMLTNKSLLKSGKHIDAILTSCIKHGITEEGKTVPLSVENLLLEDEWAILLFLRAISYGRDYEIEVECPECEKKEKHTVDIETDINVKYAGPEIEKGITVTLPRSKKKVTMHLPTKKDVGKDVYETVVNCIETSDSVEKNLIPMWMQSLPAHDVSVLRNAVNKVKWGADHSVKFVCQNKDCEKCGEPQKVGLPITSEFFRVSTND